MVWSIWMHVFQGLKAYFNSKYITLSFLLNVLEMLNILVAVTIWAVNWTSKFLEICCDNEAIVSVLNTGKTRDPLLATIPRNISMVSAKHDSSFRFTHVQGRHNVIADMSSRREGTPITFWKVKYFGSSRCGTRIFGVRSWYLMFFLFLQVSSDLGQIQDFRSLLYSEILHHHV